MARVAVESIEHVTSVETDMNAHTLTVAFDDEKTSLDTIVKALGNAGYTVPDKKKLN